MMKFAFKYFGYRFRQYRRKTNEKIVVETEYGPVKGVKRISCWNDPFYSFERIPFAKPPLGELRFREPQAPDSWQEPIDCTKEAEAPIQMNFFTQRLMGSEDCLYLNVYTKNVKPDKPLPVMVWIHGGGFVFGGTTKDTYAPDYFMMKDVIIVSLGYRVGAIGFLSLKDPSLNVPGNAGLKDQVMGLKWVKNNIEKFGGDPNNITLFGESAGAASTHYMCVTEQAKGLFQKAILMSGAVTVPWATVPDRDFPYRLAQLLGYSGEKDEAQLLEFFRSLDASVIAKSEEVFRNEEEKLANILFTFGPVIEPYVTDHCVVPKDPRLMVRDSWSNTIPIIIGGTSFEGLFNYYELRTDMSILKKNADCTHLVPLDLNLNRDSELCKEYALRLKKHHFGDEEPTFYSYSNLLSYKHFWHSLHRTLLARLKYAPNTPTYLYQFDLCVPGLNFMREFIFHNEVEGVSHGDDLGYLFLNIFVTEMDKSSKAFEHINRMISMWTSFAASGNPNCSETGSIDWTPVRSDDIKCLNISDELTLIDNPHKETLDVWDSLYTEDTLI